MRAATDGIPQHRQNVTASVNLASLVLIFALRASLDQPHGRSPEGGSSAAHRIDPILPDILGGMYASSAMMEVFTKRRLAAAVPLVILILSLVTACSLLNAPPVASFSAFPNSGSAPLTVWFDALGSSDAGGTIVAYRWEFGDGATATGRTQVHTYVLPGAYSVTLTVTDNHRDEASATQAIQVEQAAITASFVANPLSGEAPLIVNFDASGSFDPAGRSISYAWSFGDGSVGAGVTTRHTYYAIGVYTVVLTARNSSGDEDLATATVVVSATPVPGNAMPNAEFTAAPSVGQTPLTVNLDASGSSDSDGHITSYKWTFGDGASGTGATTSHTYADPGIYEIWLMVIDNAGTADAAARTIQALPAPVANNPPTAIFTASPTSGQAPLTVSFNASASTDSDGIISSYAWSFGDGAIASGVAESHTYTDAGSYTAQLTIIDDDGSSDSASRSVVVTSSVGVVSFPDAGLEGAIRDAIGKPTGDIFESDLVGMTHLVANSRGISNLEGIQYCADLVWLNLNSNLVADVTALSGLTDLAFLVLYNNQIVDIVALSGLVNITELYLDYNSITDIAALSGLTNLTRLDMSHNQIVDISALSGLTRLVDLTLTNNPVADISALSGLTNLTRLALYHNRIVDISALSGLANLTELYLFFNQITDVSALSGLTNLIRLDLYHNQIVEITALSGLTSVSTFQLHNNQISDIQSLVDNAGLSAGDYVSIHTNDLDLTSGSPDMVDIQSLEGRGVVVTY